MCAIAALASCSQNDDVAVPTDSAPPAKVTIRFAGREGMTRAIGSDDAVVNNLTAFFFNTAGALIKTPMPVAGNDLKPKITLATTTDASQVVLVANVPAGTKFDAVTSLSKLKEFVVSSLGTEASGNFPINQTKTNLMMSGWGAINMNADDNTGTANVKLHFMAAKIEKSVDEAFGEKPPAAENVIDSKALVQNELRVEKMALEDQVGTLTVQLNEKDEALAERTSQLIEKQEEIDNYIAETKTYDVVLRVKPEKASQIKSQVINGQKCLVIPMGEDEHATINGVNTTV